MGELPSPPAGLAVVFYAVAIAAFAIGAYTLISGHLLIRTGRLKQIRSQMAARLLGLDLIVWSLLTVWLERDTDVLSHGSVPSPEWLGIVLFPLTGAGLALQWLAYRIDRPPSQATSLT